MDTHATFYKVVCSLTLRQLWCLRNAVLKAASGGHYYGGELMICSVGIIIIRLQCMQHLASIVTRLSWHLPQGTWNVDYFCYHLRYSTQASPASLVSYTQT